VVGGLIPRELLTHPVNKGVAWQIRQHRGPSEVTNRRARHPSVCHSALAPLVVQPCLVCPAKANGETRYINVQLVVIVAIELPSDSAVA
jgi:hypothetical protein